MELKVLHQHGWSLSALAREFGLNWRTVKREVTSPAPRRYPARAKPTALTAAQCAHVERRVGVCPGIRGTDLHRELTRDYGYAGSYPAFQRHLRVLRPAPLREPELRFETGPGLQLQADWAHLGAWPLEGAAVQLKVLVAILGYSRAPALRFATDTTRATSLERLVGCLADLGGAPREVLTDRDPAFCVGATADGRAILAPEWVDLCGALGVVPKACRPYRAKTKGKVERLVREVKEGFLPWLSGQAVPARPLLADYDALARRWVEEVVLRRRHRTTGRVVGEAWAAERPLLAPLPPRLLGGAAALPVPVPSEAPPAGPQLRRLHDLGARVEARDLTEYEAILTAAGAP
jgi:transposase